MSLDRLSATDISLEAAIAIRKKLEEENFQQALMVRATLNVQEEKNYIRLMDEMIKTNVEFEAALIQEERCAEKRLTALNEFLKEYNVAQTKHLETQPQNAQETRSALQPVEEMVVAVRDVIASQQAVTQAQTTQQKVTQEWQKIQEKKIEVVIKELENKLFDVDGVKVVLSKEDLNALAEDLKKNVSNDMFASLKLAPHLRERFDADLENHLNEFCKNSNKNREELTRDDHVNACVKTANGLKLVNRSMLGMELKTLTGAKQRIEDKTELKSIDEKLAEAKALRTAQQEKNNQETLANTTVARPSLTPKPTPTARKNEEENQQKIPAKSSNLIRQLQLAIGNLIALEEEKTEKLLRSYFDAEYGVQMADKELARDLATFANKQASWARENANDKAFQVVQAVCNLCGTDNIALPKQNVYVVNFGQSLKAPAPIGAPRLVLL